VILASEYGPAIPFVALRHAVVASAAHALPSEQFKDIKKDHEEEGWKALSTKFNSCSTLDDSEIFAASILADMAWDSDKTSKAALQLVQRSQQALLLAQTSTDIFAVFGPYFVDGLRFCDMMGMTLSAEVSTWSLPRRASFGECRRYYEEFRRVQPDLLDGVIEAVFDTLQEILHALVCCIYRVALGNINQEIVREKSIAEATQHILNNLYDPELQQCITWVTSQHASTASNKGTAETGPSTSVFVLLDCIHLLFSVLESPSIIPGLDHSTDITTKATTIILSIRRPFLGNLHLRTLVAYEACLLLGGMALPLNDIQDCACFPSHC
jgi:hypothetical protein